jgi:hypothetical protein
MPTRVITYAWGEKYKKYVDKLLRLTLPALLAPGHLPYVVPVVPCELVVLTERRFFPSSKTIRRSRASEKFARCIFADSTI